MKIIAAVSRGKESIIGYDNHIPWDVPEDRKHFAEITIGNGNNAVIMGRNTWESLSQRPLPNRINIVLSRNPKIAIEGAHLCRSLQDAIDQAKSLACDEIYVIGGEHVYREAIDHPDCDAILLTLIKWPPAAHTSYAIARFPQTYKDEGIFMLSAESSGGWMTSRGRDHLKFKYQWWGRFRE